MSLSDGVTEAQDHAGKLPDKGAVPAALGGLVQPQAAITAVQAPPMALPLPMM